MPPSHPSGRFDLDLLLESQRWRERLERRYVVHHDTEIMADLLRLSKNEVSLKDLAQEWFDNDRPS